MKKKYIVKPIFGDYSLEIPIAYTTVVLYFNSRANAELVKDVLEYEDAHPNEAAPYLTERFKELKSLAENAERERNAAVEQLHGTCSACKHYSAYHQKGKCKNCKWDNANQACLIEYQDDCWEWKGLQEDK